MPGDGGAQGRRYLLSDLVLQPVPDADPQAVGSHGRAGPGRVPRRHSDRAALRLASAGKEGLRLASPGRAGRRLASLGRAGMRLASSRQAGRGQWRGLSGAEGGAGPWGHGVFERAQERLDRPFPL